MNTSRIDGSMLVLTAALLCGCVAHPELRQEAVVDPASASAKAYDTYGLQSSLIKVDEGSPAPTVAAQIVDAAGTRAAKDGVLFQLFLDDPFYQTTKLSITKREGTSVVETAGVQVLDARKEFLTTAGNLLSTAIAFSAPGDTPAGPSLNVPASLPFWFRAEEKVPDRRGAAKRVIANGIGAEFGAVPHNAIPLAEVIALHEHEFDGLYFSACRDLLLTVNTKLDEEEAKANPEKNVRSSKIFLKVADPNFVVRAPFPVAGSVSSHTSCGVSTTNEITTEQAAPLPGLINTAIEQGKAVKQAADEAEKARKARREAEESARKAKEAEKKAQEAAGPEAPGT